MAEIVIKLVNGELAGKTAQSIGKEINAAAQAAKKATIGTKEWIDAHKRLDEAKKLQEDLRKQIDRTKNASEALKEAWNRLPGSQYFNQIAESFSLARRGVGGLVSQFGVLKAAIAATGIGLLVIAVATLVDWFKRTDEGATLLSGIFRGLQMITDKLFAAVRNFVTAIDFSNPKKMLNDFLDFLKNQVMNRITSFSVIVEGLLEFDFKKVADGHIQLATGIENATDKMIAFGKEIAEVVKEGIALETELDRIADRERELGVQQAETEKVVSQLLLQSRNLGKSYEERLAILDRAGALEKKNLADQLKNAKDLEAALKREYDQLMAVGKVTDDVDEKYKQAQIDRINLEGKSLQVQETIENRRSQLLLKQEAERMKTFEDGLKARTAAWEEYYNNLADLEDMHIAAMDDSREKDLTELKLSLQRDIESLNVNAPFYAERLSARQELARQAKDVINKKWDEKELQDLQKLNTEQLALVQDLADLEALAATEKFANGLTNARQYNDQLSEINQKAVEDQMLLLEANGLTETEMYRELYAELLALRIKHNEEKKASDQKLLEDSLATANDITGAILANYDADKFALEQKVARAKELYGEDSDAHKKAQQSLEAFQKKNGERVKRAEKAQVAINLISEISSIWKGAAEFGPLAAVLAGIQTAAALLRAKAANTKIDATTFAKGGYVKGPSHAQGGIPGVVGRSRKPIEFEGGEFFFSKRAVDGIGVDTLTRLNNHYTRKFATGGIVNPFADRAPIQSALASRMPENNGSDQMAEMRQWIGDLISAQDRRIDRLQVINDVTKTKEGIETINKIQADADV